MARKVQNVGASVRARLLALARSKGADFQLIVTRYALERFLYRLSISAHRDRYVLKGAMLFTIWLDDPFRPTRDLDLLGFGDSDLAAIAATFREICRTEVPDDGVAFDIAHLAAEPIRDATDYRGVRVQTQATIAGARVPVRIDIGFGDVVTPRPAETEYPVLLDSPAPRLRAYPKETVVAEKFEALVSLGYTNSRMKDFYDLWMMSRRFSFDGGELGAAIRATFERRGTAMPSDMPIGLTEGFADAPDKAAQWRAFLGRDRLVVDAAAFADVVAQLRRFLMPVTLFSRVGAAQIWPPGGPWSKG